MAASSRPIAPRNLVPDPGDSPGVVGQIVDGEGQDNGIDMRNLTDHEQAAYEVVMHAIQEALSAFNPNVDGDDQ
ncbi:hypothetical protein B9Z55_022415 [Caenorhabditis nigoni]|uniref:Uncharacterized protein n=1 Tax=Caenorhabditis nigoni TaxID=1611254 RepID=A0A2G5SKI8_9PELO|nr:hypothetical protein B9Z55_022415 [Caenorhabditis nigoni]